jgi:hypothetical protein
MVSQPPQGLVLNLADHFGRTAEFLSDFLQGLGRRSVKSEPTDDEHAFSVR